MDPTALDPQHWILILENICTKLKKILQERPVTYDMHRCCAAMAAEHPSLGEHQPSHCGRDTRARHQLGFPHHHHQGHPPAPTRPQGLLIFFKDQVVRTHRVRCCCNTAWPQSSPTRIARWDPWCLEPR
jgi:hypothetical protein